MASIHETKSVFDKVGGENEDKFMSLNETGKRKKKKKKKKKAYDNNDPKSKYHY